MLEVFCDFWGSISALLHLDAVAGLRQLDRRQEITNEVLARKDLFPRGFTDAEEIRSHGGAPEDILLLQTATETLFREASKKFKNVWRKNSEAAKALPAAVARDAAVDGLQRGHLRDDLVAHLTSYL